jgi:hypothetical protein
VRVTLIRRWRSRKGSMEPLWAPRSETTITTKNNEKEVGELVAA